MTPTNYAYVFCGDSIVQKERGEKCDAGYLNNGKVSSNCSITCQPILVPTCGNNVLDANEECDDGNTRDFDDCTNQCTRRNGKCGDANIDSGLGEECDLGILNGKATSRCTKDCKFLATTTCGDGTVQTEEGEQCDAGVLNGNYPETTCLSNCLFPYCGDGAVELLEGCDDSNTFDFDGCDHTCLSESVQTAAEQIGDEQFLGKNIGGNLLGRRQSNDEKYYGTIPTPAKTPTGPGLVIFLASGAAAGIGLVRRRFLK